MRHEKEEPEERPTDIECDSRRRVVPNGTKTFVLKEEDKRAVLDAAAKGKCGSMGREY